jgi:hypothetical protein
MAPSAAERRRFDPPLLTCGASYKPPALPGDTYWRHLTTAALYNSFPWFVRFRTWPSGIDSSLRQKWPSISIKPGFLSQRGRPDQRGKFEAQKLCIPFDASKMQEPDGRLGKYSFKLEIAIGSRKSVKHDFDTKPL